MPLGHILVIGVLKKDVGHNLVGLTVGDGFKFGCGFVLAAMIAVLAALVVVTAFTAVGIFFGVKLPFFGG